MEATGAGVVGEEGAVGVDAGAAEAAAAGAMNTNSAYAVTAAQSAPPEAAQTTQTVKKKEKPKNNLKISTAALPSSGGTGLNIGV